MNCEHLTCKLAGAHYRWDQDPGKETLVKLMLEQEIQGEQKEALLHSAHQNATGSRLGTQGSVLPPNAQGMQRTSFVCKRIKIYTEFCKN